MFLSPSSHFHSEPVLPSDFIPSHNNVTCCWFPGSCTSEKLLKSFFRVIFQVTFYNLAETLYFLAIEGTRIFLQLCGKYRVLPEPLSYRKWVPWPNRKLSPHKTKFVLVFLTKCYPSEYDSLISTHRPEFQKTTLCLNTACSYHPKSPARIHTALSFM